MKTFGSFPKSNALFIVLLLTLAFTGCSKDEEIEPANGNGGNEPTKTIGSSGGEITYENLTVTIPPGAFSGDHKLEIGVSDKQHSFVKQGVTDLYRITGIPEDISEPLRIALKYDGALEDESYIAHSVIPAWDGTDLNYPVFSLLECKDSSGYLVGALQPIEEKNAAKSGNNNLKSLQPVFVELFIIGTTKWSTFEDYPEYSFIIHFPSHLISNPRRLYQKESSNWH